MVKHYWTEEETLRVLNLFLLRGCEVLNKTDVDVVELSKEFALDAFNSGRKTFPSPNSIAMKTGNFMSLHTGLGLSHTSSLDEQIWKRYAVPFLTSAGPAFQHNIAVLINPGESSVKEGRLVSVLHLLRERDPALIRAKKRIAKESGNLLCSICGFDFERRYGKIGHNFIEVHHVTPLAAYRIEGERTRLDDLILVCSNCHRMLHRINKPHAVEILKRNLN